VAQIARSISRALNLNEDLTEAIALGHDLGHTPFGHVGEEVLDELSPFGFRHNEQSLRVVDLLEREGQGLNLTQEVREGILLHSKVREGILIGVEGGTLETQVVRIADSIAYINHDIADAIRAGLISEGDLPANALSILGHTPSQRIDTMVCDVVDASWSATGLEGRGEPAIIMSSRILEAADELRDFLFQKVYNICGRGEEAKRAKEVIAFLYTYFHRHSEKLPSEYNFKQEVLERRIVDYIAGMTDRFALRLAEELGYGG
jgi:dGTPase